VKLRHALQLWACDNLRHSTTVLSMSRVHLLAYLTMALLAAVPARAEEAIAFHCTFKAVFETLESDSPTQSGIEKQFVGNRLDVLITDKPTAKVIGDVFTITKRASDYVVSQRGSRRSDWALFRTDQGSTSGTTTETITVIHIRTWNEPVRFTFAWGSAIAVGTCEEVK
jgi:hypothetical protein